MKGVGNWSLSSTQRALKKHGSDMTRIKIGWISSFSSSGRANLMNHLGIKTNTSSFSAFCPFKKTLLENSVHSTLDFSNPHGMTYFNIWATPAFFALFWAQERLMRRYLLSVGYFWAIFTCQDFMPGVWWMMCTFHFLPSFFFCTP